MGDRLPGSAKKRHSTHAGELRVGDLPRGDLPHCGGGHPRQAYFPGAISLKTRLNLARFYFSFCSTCKVYLLCTYVSKLFGCNEFFYEDLK